MDDLMVKKFRQSEHGQQPKGLRNGHSIPEEIQRTGLDNVEFHSQWEKAYTKSSSLLSSLRPHQQSPNNSTPDSSIVDVTSSHLLKGVAEFKTLGGSQPGSYSIAPTGSHPIHATNDVENYHQFVDPLDNNDSSRGGGVVVSRGGLQEHANDQVIQMNELIEAELIDQEAEERRFDGERERLRLEAMEDFKASAPKAEIVDTSHQERRRKRMIFVLLAVTLASVIAAVVASVELRVRTNGSSNGDVSRTNQMQEVIQSRFGNDIPLHQADSLYAQAFQWMVHNDTYATYPLNKAEAKALFCQRFALCVFALSTNFQLWKINHDWVSSTSECTWHGVNCNSKREISSLQLGGMKVNGTIPTELFFLTTLEHLHLHRNALKGTIPSAIGKLSQLKTLALHEQESGLVGSIPSEIGNLRTLEKLYLFGNQLSGTMPSEMKNLYNMRGLYLHNNRLSGTLSQEIIPYMVVLEALSLNNNRFRGSIHLIFGHTLLELRSFTIQNNLFTGTIPESFANMIHLTTFNYTGNNINGSFP